MTAALLTSLVLALTWTPNLSQYFISPRSRFGDRAPAADQLTPEQLMKAEEASLRGVFGNIVGFYERVLRATLEGPRWIVVLSIVLIACTYLSYRDLGSDLLPAMDEGGFVLDYLMPAGTSLEETNRVLQHVEQILHSVPEVETTSRRTGLQLGLAAVTEANTGDFTVKLKPHRGLSADDVMEEVRNKVHQAEPALNIELLQLLQDMIGDLSNAPEPIQIKLFSSDPELLKDWGPKIGDAITKVPGVVDVLDGIDNTISGPALVYQVNPAIAARAGFTPEEVAVDAAAILEGEPATTPVVTNDRAYTIRVRFPYQNRSSLSALSNTLLISSSGRTATLGDLATVQEVAGQTEIRRENLQRDITVTARLEGRDLGSGIADVKKALANLHVPSSVRVEYGGTYAEQQQSFKDLVFVLALAVVLVFLVLLFEFRNLSASIAILSSALLSTSGVVFALLITRTTFNISSFMGLIMVIGIVAKNGILLLDANQKFRASGFTPEDAMIQAARRRLRPIAMTALATVAGMLPLAAALGAGSQMLQPLAIAVIGGVLISMMLSLVITPLVYFRLEGSEQV